MPPIDRPSRCDIRLQGSALAHEDAVSLARVCVRAELSQPTQCELTFLGPRGPLARGDSPRVGDALDVVIEGSLQPLFQGEVTALEHVYDPQAGFTVHVRGYDRLHRLRKRQPLRAFGRGPLADVAGELLGAAGLAVTGLAGLSPDPAFFQAGPDDLALLQERAARHGRYFVLQDGAVRFLTLAGLADEPLPLIWGHNLLTARVLLSGEGAVRRVRASGWDPREVAAVDADAHEPQSGRTAPAEAAPDRLGGSGERHIAGRCVSAHGLAGELAQAELDRRTAAELVLEATAEGDERFAPGRKVDLQAVAPEFAGQYVLTSVRHVLDRQTGYLCELGTAPPPLPPPRPTWAFAPGVVCDVADPENLGRVRARLPAHADLETEWLRVLCPAAGPGKGFVALPAEGDHVLLGLCDGELAAGVVLGGLFDDAGPGDAGVRGNDVVRHTWNTPGGQRVRLDDAAETLRLENSDGSSLELGPARVVLHAARDLVIEAPGRRIAIRGAKIDLEKA